MDTTKAITHISLCSGYEGIGLGLRRVLPNLREIAFVEREGFPVANLVAKMEAGELDQAPVHTDLKTFPYRKFRGQVDILSGGFPCQPFSCAGKRQATDDPRHLFPYIRDGIRECQPRIVFLENVGGIISAKTGDGESVLKYVLRTLEGLGYRATAGIFSASEVGAPHQRKRVFILGMANGEDIGRGGRTHRDGDDGAGLQEQEAQEQPNLRGETAGCSGDLRGEELGNASDLRLQQSSSDSRETGTDQSGEERGVYEPQRAGSLSRYGSQSQDSQELANRIDEGSQGRIHGGQDTGRQGVNGHIGCSGSSSHRGWPSRPSEPQYEWEEPRVTGQTEPELGGASNGSTCGVDATANRVDRLRLLGNGVVNQTAAKAFVTLIQRVNNK